MKVKSTQPSILTELVSIANEIDEFMTARQAPYWVFRPTLHLIGRWIERHNQRT